MSCCNHFTDKFKKILNSDLIENVHSKYKLIEKNNIGTTKVSEMEIMANISNISFTLDKRIVDSNGHEINALGFLKRETEGINKKNDLIVICPKNNNRSLDLTVFLIELKSNNTKGALTQILSGMIFVDYLIDIYKLNFDCGFDINIKYYGIISSLCTQGVRQTSTNKNIQYPFKTRNTNGFEIPLLSWNCRHKLPLNDIHKKVNCP